MKKWRACSTYFGDGESKYTLFEFDIPDDMYETLMQAVEKRIPIYKLDCYDKLYALANEEHDRLNVIEYWEEEPDRDEYDDEDDYKDALNDYQEEKEAYLDGWNLENLEIEDPGDRLRVLDEYVGKKVADEQEDETIISEEIEQGEFDENTCYLEYKVDKDGCLIDIQATAEGLEAETIRRVVTAECIPDYGRIEEFFEELCQEFEE